MKPLIFISVIAAMISMARIPPRAHGLYLSVTNGVSVAQDDEVPQPAACDNSHAKNTEHRVHDCDCNRAHAECDPEHPKPDPMYGCRTYCHKDNCECSTRSCS